MTAEIQEILAQFRKQLLEVRGFKPSPIASGNSFGLGPLEDYFPTKAFLTGTIHEFLAQNPEDTAASEGFMAGLLAKLMKNGSSCLWISCNRKLFPPSLETYCTDPQQIIFIDLYYAKEILWVMEEGLKCEGLACVIAELSDNSVLMNYYRDGNDSVTWHSDNETALSTHPTIASVTFGQVRSFDIRSKSDHSEKYSVRLEHGSLLLMKGDLQSKWDHRIAKTTRPMKARLNLTFRVAI